MKLSDELWMANKLKECGVDIFDGDTIPAQRLQRVRQTILANGMAEQKCGSRNKVPVSFSEAFQTLYGEPL